MESIFDERLITLNTVVAEPRADANDSRNGAVFAILSAPTINPKNVYEWNFEKISIFCLHEKRTYDHQNGWCILFIFFVTIIQY